MVQKCAFAHERVNPRSVTHRAHCGPYIGFETFKTTDATLTGATGDRKGTNNT